MVSVPYQEDEACDFAVVSSRQVHEAIGGNPLQVKQWVQEAFRIHHEKKFLQPQKTYLLTSQNLYDRIIALPAAVLGDEPTLGIKWIGSHSQNHPRGLDRAHAVVVLNDPQTHATRVVMDGTLLSTWRTYAMSLVALDQFAPRPRSVGIIGMGKLGRMHAQTLGDLYPSIERIHCFSRRALHPDLLTDKRIRACEHVHDALDLEVIVTASAETAPYIHDSDLSADCRLIVNLSLMDCHADDLLLFETHGVLDRPYVIWQPTPPYGAGVNAVLRYAKFGRSTARWFTQNRAPMFGQSWQHGWLTRFLVLATRWYGRPVPTPEHVPLAQAERIAACLAELKARGTPALVNSNASSGTRICLAAKEHGLDIAGTMFRLGGEPLTPARARVVAASGSRVVTIYGMGEIGRIGLPCAHADEIDEVHVLLDKLSVIRRLRSSRAGGPPVPVNVYTTLVSSTPKLMLNVEVTTSANCASGRAVVFSISWAWACICTRSARTRS